MQQFVENFEKIKLTSEFMKFVQQKNKKDRESLHFKLMKRSGKHNNRNEAMSQSQTEPLKQLLNQQSRNSELSIMKSLDNSSKLKHAQQAIALA